MFPSSALIRVDLRPTWQLCLYLTIRSDIVQSKRLVREEEYTRNNIGKGCLKGQGNCEACQPCHGQSLKLVGDTRNYRHSRNCGYTPGYLDATSNVPDELPGSD